MTSCTHMVVLNPSITLVPGAPNTDKVHSEGRWIEKGLSFFLLYDPALSHDAMNGFMAYCRGEGQG